MWVLPDGEHDSAHHPNIAQAREGPQHEDHRQHALPDDGHDGEDDEELRERQPRIHEALQGEVERAAKVAGDRPEHDGDDQSDRQG